MPFLIHFEFLEFAALFGGPFFELYNHYPGNGPQKIHYMVGFGHAINTAIQL